MSAAEALVATRSLGLRYGENDIFHGVDLDVDPGAHMALTGRSGSGKTTLLLVLAGLLAPSSGAVSWPGLPSAPGLRRAEIGMVFQVPSLMPELTALENVTLPLRLRGVDVETARREARRALADVAAEDLADALPAQLSGGQQQRVAIARVLAGGHCLVLADEPTGALVLATHDAELADLLDQQIVVRDGTLSPSVRSR